MADALVWFITFGTAIFALLSIRTDEPDYFMLYTLLFSAGAATLVATH